MEKQAKPKNWIAGFLILFIWIVIILWLIFEVRGLNFVY